MKTKPLSWDDFLNISPVGCDVHFAAGGFAYAGIIQKVEEFEHNTIVISVESVKWRTQFSAKPWEAWWGNILPFCIGRNIRASIAEDGNQIYLGGFNRAVIDLS